MWVPAGFKSSDHPFLLLDAGAAQTAAEPIDHLNGTEDYLQAAGHQQSAEQSDVELDDVLRLSAPPPHRAVAQVTVVTVKNRSCYATDGTPTLAP